MIARLLISGRVQNVGFRHFVITKANMLGVKGAVRNLLSGDVEVIIDSSKENIALLHNFCLKGPCFSRVDNIKIEYLTEMPPDNYGFYSF